MRLGPDHMAAGTRIVIEAKQDSNITLSQALAELDIAKKNRSAAIGIHVFSKGYAPDTVEGLTR